MRPVLTLYIEGAPTEVHTDANKCGLGGIPLKQQIDGTLRLVFYFSKATSAAEQMYHSDE